MLWSFGEDDLWSTVLEASPERVADIGERAGELADSGTKNYLLLAGIEILGHTVSEPKRKRRRPKKTVPESLVRSFDESWADPQLKSVVQILDDRRQRPRAVGNIA